MRRMKSIPRMPRALTGSVCDIVELVQALEAFEAFEEERRGVNMAKEGVRERSTRLKYLTIGVAWGVGDISSEVQEGNVVDS